LVLTTTAILLLGGTVLIFLFEESNPHTMAGMSLGQKLMASLFQSVTTRTAGFATIDQARFSTAAVALCLVLMFIGGSPMGTAGGVKTTTIAVLFLSMLSNLKGKRDVEFGNRRIRSQYIRSAVVVVGVGFMTLMVSTILLAAVMPQAAFEDILYETTSAVATVGLSRGLTGSLPFAGKWILILTMYMGRIGPLTLGMAVLLRAEKHSENAHLAEEDIMIG
jgi:trk system potassium uptake protein TrkH